MRCEFLLVFFDLITANILRRLNRGATGNLNNMRQVAEAPAPGKEPARPRCTGQRDRRVLTPLFKWRTEAHRASVLSCLKFESSPTPWRSRYSQPDHDPANYAARVPLGCDAEATPVVVDASPRRRFRRESFCRGNLPRVFVLGKTVPSSARHLSQAIRVDRRIAPSIAARASTRSTACTYHASPLASPDVVAPSHRIMPRRIIHRWNG